MTRQQIMTKRVELIELRLLLSPGLSSTDCANVLELSKIAREAYGQPAPPTRLRDEPFAYHVSAVK
jgi:hypothetical protein